MDSLGCSLIPGQSRWDRTSGTEAVYVWSDHSWFSHLLTETWGLLVHTCSLSPLEIEVGRSEVRGQADHRERPSLEQQTNEGLMRMKEGGLTCLSAAIQSLFVLLHSVWLSEKKVWASDVVFRGLEQGACAARAGPATPASEGEAFQFLTPLITS